MCGIVGVVHFDRQRAVTPELVARMCGSLAHRGPDDEGIHLFRGGALGARRLSIIDVEHGHQPMLGGSGQCWIVFNGEIYNYQEIREQLTRKGHVLRTRSDTEVVVRLYEEMGESCVERLRGMFAFAVWDQRRRTLFLARDRLGIKPLYVYRDSTKLVFASEIKAILADPTIRRELDPVALGHYLSLLYVPTPWTIFKGIEKLPPASCATLRDGTYRCREYWDVLPPANGDGGPERVEADVAQALEESVRLHLVSDVPVGSWLSGGIDSSAVTCLASRLSPAPMQTYSVGFEDAAFDESPWARSVARRCNAEHHELQVKHGGFEFSLVQRILDNLDEPFADSSALATYQLAALASQHTKVTLSGDGGDELFAGYPHHRNFLLLRRLSRVAGRGPVRLLARTGTAFSALVDSDRIRRLAKAMSLGALSPGALIVGLKTYFAEADKRELLQADVLDGADVTIGEAFEPYLSRSQSFAGLQQVLYLDLKTSLPDDMLVKVDRMSMMHSLEVRVPMLDHKFVELAFRIPARDWAHLGRPKPILRRAMAGLVPASVLERPKRGFEVPLHSWSNPDFLSFARDLLNRQAVQSVGCLRWSAVEPLLDGFEGRTSPARLGMSRYQLNLRFWAVLVFQYWANTWLKARPRDEALPV